MKYKDFIVGTLFIFLLGSLFHFTYELSNYNVLVSLFSAVNESVFEHTKLLLYPTIIWYLIFYLMNNNINKNRLFSSMVINIIISCLSIIIIYYTYTGIFGISSLFIDIIIFIISIIIGFITSLYIYNKNVRLPWKLILIIIIILYSYFTFYPLNIPLFK